MWTYLPTYLHRLTMSGVAPVDRVRGRKGGEAGKAGGTRKGLLDRLVGAALGDGSTPSRRNEMG